MNGEIASAADRPVHSVVDPRIRERWIAARRAEGRRRLKFLVAALVVGLVGVAVWVVAASPFLDVDRVIVRGAAHSTTTDILSAADVHSGDPMVWLDAGAIEDRVDSLPWVRTARVTRDWPGSVTITVTERRAVAWVDSAAGPTLVDRTGRVLQLVQAPPSDLPHVIDVERVPPVGATISPSVGAEVAGRLAGLARSGTRSIAVGATGVRLGLVSGPEIRLGTPYGVMTKVQAAVAVLTALEGVPVRYVDVSVPSNPVAGPPA